MLNPQQPQKKGFRAFAERDNERKLADGAAAGADSAAQTATKPVMAPSATDADKKPKR